MIIGSLQKIECNTASMYMCNGDNRFSVAYLTVLYDLRIIQRLIS
jgi:hypothetical protein